VLECRVLSPPIGYNAGMGYLFTLLPFAVAVVTFLAFRKRPLLTRFALAGLAFIFAFVIETGIVFTMPGDK
jgi:hypothetical protein